MASSPSSDIPEDAFLAASFAERLSQSHADGTNDLFVAFVALVSAQNQQVCADCLMALEAALLLRASGKNASPSA